MQEYLLNSSTILLLLAGWVLISISTIFTNRIRKRSNILLELKQKTEQLRCTEELLWQLQKYTNELERICENLRVFRHDYVNILSTMDGFFKEKEWIELEKYFKQKILPAGKQLDQSHYRLGLLKNIKIIELKGILSIKAIYAQDKDVEFRLDVANEITYFDMDIIDLCRCVGIILDNAIEAALMSKSKRVDCGIIKRKKSVLIVVHNTYDGENIDIRKIYNKGYTTKSKDDKSRGLGLFTLKRITDSYSNVNMEAEIDNKEFKIGIEVLKK